MMNRKILALASAAVMTAGLLSVPSFAAVKYADGTYTGASRGMGGDITVTITIQDDVITVDEITGKYETPGVGGKEAIEDGTFKAMIEEAQSSDIEGIAGATMTSGGVSRAVKDILTQAMTAAVNQAAEKEETETVERMYADGTYTGASRGMGGDITVTVTIQDDVITVDEITGKYETPGVGGKEAIEDGTFKAMIEAAQSAEIEGIAGATMTSGGVSRAMADILQQARAAAAAAKEAANKVTVYKDGTYTGTARGMGGEISVTLTIKEDVITVDEITGKYETPGVGGKEAIEDGSFKAMIEEAQSSDIEGIAGATMTSGGVKRAVEDALAQAKNA